MKKVLKKYTVTNDRFSRDIWVATLDEIIDGIIECNWSWETDYARDDFHVNFQGDLFCKNEKIGEESL